MALALPALGAEGGAALIEAWACFFGGITLGLELDEYIYYGLFHDRAHRGYQRATQMGEWFNS